MTQNSWHKWHVCLNFPSSWMHIKAARLWISWSCWCLDRNYKVSNVGGIFSASRSSVDFMSSNNYEVILSRRNHFKVACTVTWHQDQSQFAEAAASSWVTICKILVPIWQLSKWRFCRFKDANNTLRSQEKAALIWCATFKEEATNFDCLILKSIV